MTTATHQRFAALCASVAACQQCERMSHSARILSEASGRLDASFMFIGEAPGRLGADQTAIPFHGDATGGNFERLLSEAGIDRNRVYVTNAVLCNPRDANGNNATPLDAEVLNCSRFLKRQIELIRPKVIATLGARALFALGKIEHHGLKLADAVGVETPWFGRSLVPLYHPGARAMIHRPFHVQRKDYLALASVALPPQRATFSAIEVAVAILQVADRTMSYFALHKLFYLVEYYAFRDTGKRLTDAYIIRQRNGPYVTDIFFKTLLKKVARIKPLYRNNELYLMLTRSDPESLFSDIPDDGRADSLRSIILPIIARYKNSTEAELKTASYLTSPMRRILRDERLLGRALNRPIPF